MESNLLGLVFVDLNLQEYAKKILEKIHATYPLKALRVYERTLNVQEKSAGQCSQSGASFDPINSIEDKENSNPARKISMSSAGPTSSCYCPGVPRAVQEFSFTSFNLTHFGAFAACHYSSYIFKRKNCNDKPSASRSLGRCPL